jgi:peptidoglycan-associated lipoprotein
MKKSILLTLLFSIAIWGCSKKQTVKQEEPIKQPEVQAPVPAAPATPPPAEPAAALPKLDLQAIYFEFDSYALRAEAKEMLNKAGSLLRSYPEISLRLEGHCDQRGTAEYNLALGEKRANAVRNYLMDLGVAKSRLSTVSYGKEKPAALGNDEESWAKNRRVEIFPAGK